MEFTIEKVMKIKRELDINLLSGGDDVYECKQKIRDLITSNKMMLNLKMSKVFVIENDEFKIVNDNYVFLDGIDEHSKEYIDLMETKNKRERQLQKLYDDLELLIYNYHALVIPFIDENAKINTESIQEFTYKWNEFSKSTIKSYGEEDKSGK